eukprot:341737_1
MSEVTTVGDKVKLKKDNLVGSVRFIGEIKGKQGIFYGIELDDKYKSKGKNDGSVKKTCYFKCKNKSGLFVKETAIIKTNSKNNQNVPRVTIGDKIECIKAKCKGTIKFIGIPYSMKKTNIFYGVELEKPKGTNNGTIKDRYYFKCKNKYGIMLKEEDFNSHQQKLIKTTGKSPRSQKPLKSTKTPKTLSLSRKNSKNSITEEKNHQIDDIPQITDENDIYDDDDEDDEGYIDIDIVANGLNRLRDLVMKKNKIIKMLRSQNPSANISNNINITENNINDVVDKDIEIKKLKDLLKDKEDEIIKQKQLYKELEIKYKTLIEVDSMKMLLEEQKHINKALMEKIDALEKQTENVSEEIENVSEKIDEDMKLNDNLEPEIEIEVVKKEPRIILDEHIDGLMSGYIRELYTNNSSDDIEDIIYEIIDICVMYYFIAPLFTNSHSKHATMIEKGTRFVSSGVDNIDICYPSDEGFRNGIHMWRLLCIDCAEREIDEINVGYAIGVSTDFMNCDRLIDKLQNSIYYDGNSGIISRCFKEKICDTKSKWGKGDEIVLSLDCDERKISFYKNGENVGIYDIETQKAYYLIVQLNSSKGYDFKLTQYF